MPGPQEALSAAYDSWIAGDLEGYLRLYDEGIRLHGYSPEPMGKAQVRGFYEGIFSAFDTPKLSFEEVYLIREWVPARQAAADLALGVVAGPAGVAGSGGGVEGDGVSEGFELGDEPAGFAFGVQAGAGSLRLGEAMPR